MDDWNIPISDPTSGGFDFGFGTGGLDTSGFDSSGIMQAIQSNPGLLQQLSQAMGVAPQSLISTLLGAAGPMAGLLGAISGGGRGPTTSQTQSGTNQFANAQNSASNQTGASNFANMGSVMPQLMDPAAAAGMYAQGGLQAMSPFAQALYGQGAGMLGGMGSQFLMGQTPAQQAQMGAVSNLMGTGAPATGSFMNVSMSPDPAIADLVKKSYQPYIGNITQQAIEAARSHGFAGGADLLGTGAAPFAGLALANLPGMEANSLLDMMTKIPLAQAQIGSAESQAAAQAAGIPIQAQIAAGQLAGQQAGQQMSLLPQMIQQMMNPLSQYITGQQNLLTGYPAGSNTTQTGSSNQQQAGTNTTNQSGTSGFGTSGTGTSQVPMGNVIGQGIGSVLQGGAAGLTAAQQAQANQDFQRAIASYLSGRAQPTLSGVG